MERLVTAWVRMHHGKDRSAGVGWDGCTQSTPTKARTGLRERKSHSFVENKEFNQNKKMRRRGRASRRVASNAARNACKRQETTLTCGGIDLKCAHPDCEREARV